MSLELETEVVPIILRRPMLACLLTRRVAHQWSGETHLNSSLLKKAEFDEFGRSILLNSIKTGFQRRSGALQLEVASVNDKYFSMFVERGALRGIRLIPFKKIPVESPHFVKSLHLVGSAPLAVVTPGSSLKSKYNFVKKFFRRLLALLNHLVDGFS